MCAWGAHWAESISATHRNILHRLALKGTTLKGTRRTMLPPRLVASKKTVSAQTLVSASALISVGKEHSSELLYNRAPRPPPCQVRVRCVPPSPLPLGILGEPVGILGEPPPLSSPLPMNHQFCDAEPVGILGERKKRCRRKEPLNERRVEIEA